MNFDTETAGQYACEKLDLLLQRAERDTAEAVAKNDIPTAVVHFAKFRTLVRLLAEKMTALQKHVDSMSYELLPTMFDNQGVKTIKIDDVGRVTINVRWNASMIDKAAGLEWLRSTGNDGLIIETVNASTLAGFAKERALEGKPLPDDVFTVGTAQLVSITKV
jgi:hypothetical protein